MADQFLGLSGLLSTLGAARDSLQLNRDHRYEAMQRSDPEEAWAKDDWGETKCSSLLQVLHTTPRAADGGLGPSWSSWSLGVANSRSMGSTASDVRGCCADCLSPKLRCVGFSCCVVVAVLMQGLVFLALSGFEGDPGHFRILFASSNLLLFFGSFFLAGPWEQCSDRSERGREQTRNAIAVLLITLFTVAATNTNLVWGRARTDIVFGATFLQWIVDAWYIRSYLPWCRRAGGSGRSRSISHLQV
uniref:Vesicle transport protein n=1 Tax=Noctiluca scintillans TaxID=2966 RepID=A0A7S1AKA7_NOCSC|mmetsp:Transcript_48172/g.127564  ORF Transcript_48172/g.127564 Transcript_48172/m.127564 type:complete len:246 (+) Transcript_48172:63-800(+)